ncbi:MAG: response regulator transcription factor [Candidatus Sericytochromatia bacterium]|nr:response regulator transcription factor [Candidatus Tanganyikabacteria bacterium]
MTIPPHVWIVDDDQSLRKLYAFILEQEGFSTEKFGSKEEVLLRLKAGPPDLLLLDLGLPDGDGQEICRIFRDDPAAAAIPIVVVTGSLDMTDRYRALAEGADDFLTKPIDQMELVLRMRNLLKRAAGFHLRDTECLRAGDLELDLRNHELRSGERQVQLTPSEFAILRHLLERVGVPVSAETLLVEALGYPPRLGNPEILRAHVKKIRRKIEDNPDEPRILVNRPRLGYMVPEPRRA